MRFTGTTACFVFTRNKATRDFHHTFHTPKTPLKAQPISSRKKNSMKPTLKIKSCLPAICWWSSKKNVNGHHLISASFTTALFLNAVVRQSVRGHCCRVSTYFFFCKNLIIVEKRYILGRRPEYFLLTTGTNLLPYFSRTKLSSIFWSLHL